MLFSSVDVKDFYSHSNWVKLGYKLPNANLIRSDTSIGNVAGTRLTLKHVSIIVSVGYRAGLTLCGAPG